MAQQQYQAVVFDMDGVMFDSEPLHIKAWQVVMAELGYDLPYEAIATCIGIPDYDSAHFVQRYCGTEISAEELLARKTALYPEMAAAAVTPFPGVAEGLAQLSARVPIALATSCFAYETELLLGRTNLIQFFPIRVTAEMVTQRKPEPEPFQLAMNLIGSVPAHTLAVEDSPAGVMAARAAGCTVLAVTSSHKPAQLAQAHRIFPTTAEAIEWMLGEVISE